MKSICRGIIWACAYFLIFLGLLWLSLMLLLGIAVAFDISRLLETRLMGQISFPLAAVVALLVIIRKRRTVQRMVHDMAP